jgi:soluble lytic murein transglycosylase
MIRRIASLLLLALLLAGPAAAQPAPAGLDALRAAFQAADAGTLDDAGLAAYANHPLYGWLQLARMRRNLDAVDDVQARAFLARYGGQPAGEAFRPLWLAALSRRQDWPGLLAAWKPTQNTALRCARLQALQATGKADAQWNEEVQALWRDAGKSLPDGCDAVFAAWQAQGGLTDALRWQRLEAAAEAGDAGVMRAAARGLSAPADQAQAAAYAAFIASPATTSPQEWPATARSRRIAVAGLKLLARNNPDQAEARLPQVARALQLDDAQQGQVLYQVALWTVASYLPDSARRLAAVPAAAWDERLHEWQAREAMARGDWPAALAAIRRMPAAQRGDPRWQYFEARLAEKTGDAATAARLYRAAATSPTFHGFLAADRSGQPYALCPWTPDDSDRDKAAVARDPGLARALLLYQVDRAGWAVLEWNAAIADFDDTRRRLAVEAAQDVGWFDRAVFALGKTPAGQARPDELRLYALRFPLHHDATIRREAARNGLDPAWVAAEIRAESVFNPNARSPANAMGLMQVIPATGAQVARRIGVAGYAGAASLYDPDINIAIGSAYLRQLLDKYAGQPYMTMAAYNAGPAAAARWQGQRPSHDPDFWIETITYKETRDYVARVLAFSVIYDWRLNGDALPLSDRMVGTLNDARHAFACPPAATGATL